MSCDTINPGGRSFSAPDISCESTSYGVRHPNPRVFSILHHHCIKIHFIYLTMLSEESTNSIARALIGLLWQFFSIALLIMPLFGLATAGLQRAVSCLPPPCMDMGNIVYDQASAVGPQRESLLVITYIATRRGRMQHNFQPPALRLSLASIIHVFESVHRSLL